MIRRLISCASAVIYAAVIMSFLTVSVAKADGEYVEGELLVRFGTDRLTALSSSQISATLDSLIEGCTIDKEYHIVPGLVKITLPATMTESAAITILSGSGSVRYAELNYLQYAQATPNDPSFDELWGMHNTGQTGGVYDADIDALEAWDIATGSEDVIVAVIDTGVDYTHPDLVDNMWTNEAELNGEEGVDDDGNGYIDDIYGYNFCSIDPDNPSDGDPMDDHSHGTHCSGTIGAVGDNGVGVAGVCWNVKIMALKFLASFNSGSTSDAINCIQYAMDNGATFTSNSWGGGGYNQALYDAIEAAGKAGQMFVAAAGNSATDNDAIPHYPSSYDLDYILAVMSTDSSDDVSSFFLLWFDFC